jgi:hypothetical protein
MTPQTISSIIAKAMQQARSVAMESAWPTPETIEFLITTADVQAKELAKKVGKKMAEA